MTPGGRLAAIIELLQAVYEVPRPADGTLAAYFRGRRYIGSKDRAFIAEKVYDALRHHARLGWWIKHQGGTITPRTRALANAMLADGQPARIIRDMFTGNYGPIGLSKYEAELVQRLDGHTLGHPGMPDAVAVECPEWAEPMLRAALGGDFLREMRALIPAASMDLRVNTLKTEREAAVEQLNADGIVCRATLLSPIGIRVTGRPSLMAHDLYRQGAVEIQDEGSQLVALLADARAGHAVLDFCAGAGGKTLAIGAAMQNRGRIVATDVLDSRLERAQDRFKRAGLQNVEIRPLDGEANQWLKRRRAGFDRVLVDAPCSGTGTWRRNPDMRWRPLGPKVAELTQMQADILARAATMVKPGGRLIYATCSLLREENQDIVAGFLQAHPEFRVLPVGEVWADTIGGDCPVSGEFLSLSPARNDTDGFFAAVMERAAT